MRRGLRGEAYSGSMGLPSQAAASDRLHEINNPPSRHALRGRGQRRGVLASGGNGMEQQEEWRACVGWPEYEVSDQGRVRRVARGHGARVGTIRAQVLNPQGYWTVMLGGVAGRDVRVPVHRLMVEAFIGPLGKRGDGGYEVNHKNGIKSDNRLENLERVTHKQNCQHAYANGLNDRRNHRGEKSGAHRLTEVQVRDIRKRLADGEKCKPLSQEYGIGLRTVYGVKNRETWGWLE